MLTGQHRYKDRLWLFLHALDADLHFSCNFFAVALAVAVIYILF
jgi:hypothetical protein